jgi:hypothetical protein
MALIKNVERTLAINASYGLSDLLNYMASSVTTSTTEITVITKGVGTPDPTYLWLPGASSGGSMYTGKTVVLSTTINATDLIIQAPGGSLATWPDSGYIYFISPSEGIYYDDIISWNTTGTGFDHFIVPAVSSRGWSGTASSHTALAVINEIAVWFVQSINYDTSSGLFNFSYFAREASRVNYLAPDIPGKVYSQERSLGGSLFNAYELVEESAT